MEKEQYAWVGLRFVMAFTFLWAFFDKLFGLGFSTCRGSDGVVHFGCSSAWLGGGSPTTGFLAHTGGWLSPVFKAMAGSALVDWLFMIGLFCIGVALLFGAGVRIAGYSGALLVFLMWLASVPPANNPLFDEHVIEFFVLLGLAFVDAGQWWGVGEWWSGTAIVKRYPWLR